MNKRQKEFLQEINSRAPSFDARVEKVGIVIKDLYKLEQKNQFEKLKVDDLRHTYLEQNNMYVILQGQIENWNALIDKLNSGQIKEIDKGHWRAILIKNLFNMLKEVMMTTDRGVQGKFLEHAHNWYFSELSAKGGGSSENQRPKTSAARQQIHATRPQTSNSESLFSASDNFYNLFSNSEFDKGNRTRHPTMDPPEDRIKGYLRKTLAPSDTVSTENLSRPATSHLSVPGFSNLSRPQSSPFGTGYDPRGLANGNEIRPNTGEGRSRSGGELNLNPPAWRKSSEENIKKEPIVNIGVFLASNQRAAAEGEGKKPGGEAEELVSRNEFEPEPDFTFKGINSNFLHFQPETDEANKFLENYWLRQRHVDLQKIKENEYYKDYMHKWASTKGQFHEELNRKGEASLYGNRFESVEFERKPYEVKDGEDDLVFVDPPGIQNSDFNPSASSKEKTRKPSDPSPIKCETPTKKGSVTARTGGAQGVFFSSPVDKNVSLEASNLQQTEGPSAVPQKSNAKALKLAVAKDSPAKVGQGLPSAERKNSFKNGLKCSVQSGEKKEPDEYVTSKKFKLPEGMVKNSSANLPEKIKMKYWVNNPKVVKDDRLKAQVSVIDLGSEIKKALAQKTSPFDIEDQAKKGQPYLKNFEKLKSKDKIADIRKLYGGFIKLRNGKAEIEEPSPSLAKSRAAMSLSVHGRPLTSDPYATGFSKHFRSGLRNEYNRASIEEIKEIKNRFSSQNLTCSMETLKKALIIPDGLPPDVIENMPLRLFPSMSSSHIEIALKVNQMLENRDSKKAKKK